MIAIVCAVALVLAIAVDKLDVNGTVAAYLKTNLAPSFTAAGHVGGALLQVAKWALIVGLLLGGPATVIIGIPLMIWELAGIEMRYGS